MLSAVEPNRGSDGFWVHPDLALAKGVPTEDWAQSNQIDLAWEQMEDTDSTERVCLAGWEPESPGDEWRLLTVTETADGPFVAWYRPAKGIYRG